MAKSPNANSTSAGFSTVPSTAYNNLDNPINFNPSEPVQRGWVWEHGYDIGKAGSGRRSWLCKECHRKRVTTTHIYDSTSTSQANSHMKSAHRINKDGQLPLKRKKQRTLFDMADLDSHRPKDQALMNAFIASFYPFHFQGLLIRCVACDNVPFNKLESPYFRDLVGYANGAIIESGSPPTHSTMREWIVRSFNLHKVS